MSWDLIGRDEEDFSDESIFKVSHDLKSTLLVELQKENK